MPKKNILPKSAPYFKKVEKEEKELPKSKVIPKVKYDIVLKAKEENEL